MTQQEMTTGLPTKTHWNLRAQAGEREQQSEPLWMPGFLLFPQTSIYGSHVHDSL